MHLKLKDIVLVAMATDVMHILKDAFFDNKQASISKTVKSKWLKIAIFKPLHEFCIAFKQIEKKKNYACFSIFWRRGLNINLLKWKCVMHLIRCTRAVIFIKVN